ncbi:hypothetical protein F2Q69_00048250 [Brassica cretica]|uniref:Uncharacterized protein n=1 Tax=Brassica cretica TaxID=69181 RepID=A0A8S9PX78_BRACR|nr:hypothetical protein F2Q69_00048250 [Brassica cretica]
MHGFVSYRRFGKVRLLRSDRAMYVLGRYVATELGWSSVATCSIEIRTGFYRKALRKDFFTKITFRKNVHADFYGLSDIDSAVTDFDPNTYVLGANGKENDVYLEVKAHGLDTIPEVSEYVDAFEHF